MKTQFFIVMLVTTMSFSMTCLAQGHSIHWPSNNIGVVFSDQSLASTCQTAIVADLQRCFQGWGKGAEIMLRVAGDSAGYMSYGKRCPCYSQGIEFPRNIVALPSGGIALQISKTLSDAYTNAFAFAATHSNAVAAAHEYVAFVSSTNFHSVTSNEIANYYFANKAPPVVYQLSFPDITNFLHDTTFYPPSVLGFFKSDIGPSVTNLWMYVPSSSNPYGDVIEWSPWTAIWHDGRWKLCIWEDDPEYELPDGTPLKE